MSRLTASVPWELIPLSPFVDSRGALKKVLQQSQLGVSIREAFLLYTLQGAIRGNHYHCSTQEYFFVVQGTALFALQDPGEYAPRTLELSAQDNLLLKVPPGVAHVFINKGKGLLIILALSTREYSKEDLDTFPQILLG